MNEEQAKKILAGMNHLTLIELDPNEDGRYLIDDYYTIEELEALVWFLRNKESV